MDQIVSEFPDSLKTLTENHENLMKVAEYCTEYYTQTGGDVESLAHTRSLVTHSLASVAFQINSVADSFLKLLDLQNQDLTRLQSSVCLLQQSVDMHTEKVSRRVIGSFTFQRRVPRSMKLLPPAQPKPRPPYTRQPISFQILDSVGHGVKSVSGKVLERGGSGRSQTSFRRQAVAAETVQSSTAVGSFGRLVAPPSVPTSWKAPPSSADVTEETPPPSAEVANETAAVPPPPPPPPVSNQDESLLPMAPPLPPAAPPPPPVAPPTHLAPPTIPLAPPPPPAAPPAPPLAPPTPPPLETVFEESCFPPPPDDIIEATPPSPEDAESLPPPPPPPPITEDSACFGPRRSRHRAPPTARSHSLRVRSGPASRCFTRSLFLPVGQSLMIPPPPCFPPPTAPPSWPRPLQHHSATCALLKELQHLDLEIPPPPLDLDQD